LPPVGVLGAKPPVGSRGNAPGGGRGGKAPRLARGASSRAGFSLSPLPPSVVFELLLGCLPGGCCVVPRAWR
jgi:hypothetical protein